MSYATTGNASLFLPYCEDEVDLDYAEDFGFTVEQPHPRERREHRRAYLHNEDGRGVTSAPAVATTEELESL